MTDQTETTASPSNRRAFVHNAITDALSAAGDWVPLSVRIAATRAALAEVDAWYAGGAPPAAAGVAPAANQTDLGTEFVRQADQPDEAAIAAFEATLPEHTEPKADSKAERRDRYAAAMAKRDGDTWPTQYADDEADYRRRADAVMAVADAEQAELQGRLAHLQTTSEAAGILLARTTDHRDRFQAAIERVQGVLPFAEQVAATSGPGPASAVNAVLDRLRAALDGTEPAAASVVDQTEPDDTDLTEADIDRMMAASVPVQIVTAPPQTYAAAPAVDRAAVLREAADALGRMDYDADSNDYGYDTYRDAWNGGVMDGADLLRRLADEAQQQPAAHVYLSTGCLHGQHGYCSNVDGIAGLKKPAQCKFCAAPCVCPCHHKTQQQSAAADGEEPQP